MPRHDAWNFERRGRGEPLVLLHGIGGELCVWEPVLERLARAHDVIAVDLPGFGHSRSLTQDVVRLITEVATPADRGLGAATAERGVAARPH